jgi:phosphoglycerate dehydrogenase-like enzyme
VSDHTIALMLASLRMLVFSDAAVRKGMWPSAVQLTSMRRVRGTRLGLVGFGRIASAVATKAVSLGMEVAAYDPFIPAQLLHQRGVGQASTLVDLLKQSDVISLHLPPSGDGRPILGPDEFRVMRRGAVIINTGRGSLVDETCLHEALSSGYLSAAGLDVFQSEPLSSGSPLIDLDNVVLTPHSAAFSEQALSEIRQSALADVVAVLNGHTPVHPVES